MSNLSDSEMAWPTDKRHELVAKQGKSVFGVELKIVDEELDVIADRKDWPDCLTKALLFYKQIEDYESCSKCQKLLDKINSKPKKRTTKSNG
jgi:hypothetical protein